MRFYQLVRQARLKNYISQRDISKVLGMDFKDYHKIENGQLKCPSLLIEKLNIPLTPENFKLWEEDNKNIPYPQEEVTGIGIACGQNGCKPIQVKYKRTI